MESSLHIARSHAKNDVGRHHCCVPGNTPPSRPRHGAQAVESEPLVPANALINSCMTSTRTPVQFSVLLFQNSASDTNGAQGTQRKATDSTRRRRHRHLVGGLGLLLVQVLLPRDPNLEGAPQGGDHQVRPLNVILESWIGTTKGIMHSNPNELATWPGGGTRRRQVDAAKEGRKA